MTYIMSCVWLDYMVKYFQCKNCVGSSPKTKKCVASFLVPGDTLPDACAFGSFIIFRQKDPSGITGRVDFFVLLHKKHTVVIELFARVLFELAEQILNSEL